MPFFVSERVHDMGLNERITDDMKTAMRSGEKTKLETLRSLRAHFIELSKRGDGKEITPEDELSVLLTAVKKRKEAIDLFRKGGREELAKQEEHELEIINSYLPKQVTKEEAAAIIATIISQTGASTPKDFGKVMPAAMKELKGKIDGKVVQELVKEKLQG
jgi:hypothetical protein